MMEHLAPGAAEHDAFMAKALARAWEEARSGSRPIYCIVVRDGKIIGEAPNTVARDKDPTAHGEVNAIRDACRRAGTTDLSGCTLYTPMEPCPMCLASILESGISTLVLGARHRRVGRKDVGDYSVESLLSVLKRELDIVSGVKEAECERLRTEGLQATSFSGR
jgi:tRNA(Arg) A34 adenosine deaminase TadA